MTTDFGTSFKLTEDGDLDLAFPSVTGHACLAQSLVLRFKTPHGSLFWAPDDGEDLEAQVQKAQTPATLSALRARVVRQAERDERVLSASCRTEMNASTEVLTLTIGIVPRDNPSKPFELVLAIDKVTVKVLKSP